MLMIHKLRPSVSVLQNDHVCIAKINKWQGVVGCDQNGKSVGSGGKQVKVVTLNFKEK